MVEFRRSGAHRKVGIAMPDAVRVYFSAYPLTCVRSFSVPNFGMALAGFAIRNPRFGVSKEGHISDDL